MERITFKPLRVRRLSQVIEHDIRALILKGELKPGERLPPEKEIGKQFGVSSVTVREALKALEAYGFIEKKRGRGGGIFVIDTSADSVKIPLYNILRKRDFSERHVAELRTIVEPAAIKIATPQITSSEITELEKNVSYCESKIEKAEHFSHESDFFDIEERNAEFHRLIAQATNNPVLALTIDYAVDFVLTIKRISFKKGILTPDIAFSTELIRDHRNILTKLKESDAQGGEKEMLSHLRKIEQNPAKKGV